MTDTNMVWVLLALGAVALALVVAVVVARRRKQRVLSTAELRARFGPEYDRAVKTYGPRRARGVLEARLRRVEKIKIRELSREQRARFSADWSAIQAQFVDDPRGAAARANELVKDVMQARGYSRNDAFEQRVADLSVDHPEVIQHYRAAHALWRSGAEDTMNTEDLRQSIVHYRVLFADLLGPSQTLPTMLRPVHA